MPILPFKRMQHHAFMLDNCANMIEDVVEDIGACLNKDEHKAASLLESFDVMTELYDELLDDLEDDEATINPRLHPYKYPLVQRGIRQACDRCQKAVAQLEALGEMQDELAGIECYANGEVGFEDDF